MKNLENHKKRLGKIHRTTLENHGKTIENHRKPLTKDRGGNRTQDPPPSYWRGGGGGGIKWIIHALRPETPFSHRKRKLAIARGTPASSASFREMLETCCKNKAKPNVLWYHYKTTTTITTTTTATIVAPSGSSQPIARDVLRSDRCYTLFASMCTLAAQRLAVGKWKTSLVAGFLRGILYLVISSAFCVTWILTWLAFDGLHTCFCFQVPSSIFLLHALNLPQHLVVYPGQCFFRELPRFSKTAY